MNGSGPTGIAAGVLGFVVGGIIARALSDALTLAGALTVLTTGIGHYGTVLILRNRDLPREQERRLIEQATGVGFFIGAAASLAILLIDAIAA